MNATLGPDVPCGLILVGHSEALRDPGPDVGGGASKLGTRPASKTESSEPPVESGCKRPKPSLAILADGFAGLHGVIRPRHIFLCANSKPS